MEVVVHEAPREKPHVVGLQAFVEDSQELAAVVVVLEDDLPARPAVVMW